MDAHQAHAQGLQGHDEQGIVDGNPEPNLVSRPVSCVVEKFPPQNSGSLPFRLIGVTLLVWLSIPPQVDGAPRCPVFS